MQELSLNILDIAQNSIRANASMIEISIEKQLSSDQMTIRIDDNGCGMTAQQVQAVENPFFTTRTTRPVGLGVPLFKMSAEMTGGSFKIESTVDVGTKVTAIYGLSHIDLMPLGDMTATMITLIGMNPSIDFIYSYKLNEQSFCLDTREVRELLEGIALDQPEVLAWITEYLNENTAEIEAGT